MGKIRTLRNIGGDKIGMGRREVKMERGKQCRKIQGSKRRIKKKSKERKNRERKVKGKEGKGREKVKRESQ